MSQSPSPAPPNPPPPNPAEGSVRRRQRPPLPTSSPLPTPVPAETPLTPIEKVVLARAAEYSPGAARVALYGICNGGCIPFPDFWKGGHAADEEVASAAVLLLRDPSWCAARVPLLRVLYGGTIGESWNPPRTLLTLAVLSAIQDLADA